MRIHARCIRFLPAVPPAAVLRRSTRLRTFGGCPAAALGCPRATRRGPTVRPWCPRPGDGTYPFATAGRRRVDIRALVRRRSRNVHRRGERLACRHKPRRYRQTAERPLPRECRWRHARGTDDRQHQADEGQRETVFMSNLCKLEAAVPGGSPSVRQSCRGLTIASRRPQVTPAVEIVDSGASGARGSDCRRADRRVIRRLVENLRRLHQIFDTLVPSTVHGGYGPRDGRLSGAGFRRGQIVRGFTSGNTQDVNRGDARACRVAPGHGIRQRSARIRRSPA